MPRDGHVYETGSVQIDPAIAGPTVEGEGDAKREIHTVTSRQLQNLFGNERPEERRRPARRRRFKGWGPCIQVRWSLLARRRAEADKSVEEVAADAGLARIDVEEIERGKIDDLADRTDRTLQRLAVSVGCDLEDCFPLVLPDEFAESPNTITGTAKVADEGEHRSPAEVRAVIDQRIAAAKEQSLDAAEAELASLRRDMDLAQIRTDMDNVRDSLPEPVDTSAVERAQARLREARQAIGDLARRNGIEKLEDVIR